MFKLYLKGLQLTTVLFIFCIFCTCCCCSCTTAISSGGGGGSGSGGSNNALILKFKNDNMDTDGYAFSFETSDGISREESAMLKHAGTELEAIAVRGSVNWVGADGVHYKLNYLADENGFQPQGEHLPHQQQQQPQ